MEVPEGLEEKMYKTLITLYAKKMGVTIKCKMKFGGEMVEIDTSKILLEKRE